jgi:lysophospholipase L1-like esterase
MTRSRTIAIAAALCAASALAQEPAKVPSGNTATAQTAAAAPPTATPEEEILPACMKPVPRPDGAGGRQDEALRRVRDAKGSTRVVFLGDSITQGWEDAGAQAWARDYEPLGALQIGVGGDRTEHVLWRLAQAPLTPLDPEVVVLMIGTNNASTGRDSGELIVRAIRAIVDALIRQCPRAQVIVLDIPPRGQRVNPLRGLVLQVNQALSQVDWPARARFVRVADEFVRGDGSLDEQALPDFLHFSPQGYERWSRSIRPVVTSLLAAPQPHPSHPAVAAPPSVPQAAAPAPAAAPAASPTPRTGT